MEKQIKPKKSYLQKFIDFIAKILSIKRKDKEAKKDSSDDIYTIW